MATLALRIFRILALGFLFVGLVLPWFRVPVGLVEKPLLTFAPQFAEPVATTAVKALVAAILVVTWLIGRRKRKSDATRSAWGAPMRSAGCIILLLAGIIFPAMTIQRCASISAHAAWLQVQNDSFIRPFGDAFKSQEYEHEPGQPELQVKEVSPRAFEVFPTPLLNSFSDLNLSRLEEMLTWVGFSPAFCQFAYWGWYCVIVGSGLLFAVYVREDKGDGTIRFAVKLIPALMLAGLLVSVGCLTPIVIAGVNLMKSQTAAANGRFSESLRDLDTAKAWVPALAYGSGMLYQRGYLAARLGLDTPERMLLTAVTNDEDGIEDRASTLYLGLLDSKSDPVKKEAFRGALRLALKDFNSGLVDRAGNTLNRLLAVDPTSIKVIYALQLVDLRNHLKSRLEADVSRFEVVYKTFQSHEKGAIVASAHRRLADLEFDFGDKERLTEEMSAAIKPE